MKPQATIYPFGQDDIQLFRYPKFIDEFEPVCPVSPPGWALNGIDVGCIDGGQPVGYKVTSDLSTALDKTNILVLTSFKNFFGKRGNFDETIKLAALKGVKVIISELPDKFDQENLNHLKNMGLLKKVFPLPIDWKLNPLARMKLAVPVVLIFGEGPSTDKFEVQLAIRNELLNKNYKLTQVGSRFNCELFGFHSFPSFMYAKNLSEIEKIINLNNYLKHWETEEQPDLILIGVPQGIVPITEEIHNDFGMTLLEVIAASEPDLAINTLYNLDYLPEFYMNKTIYNLGKLGCETGCFVLSRYWLDIINTKNDCILSTLKLRNKIDHLPKVTNPATGATFPLVSMQQPNSSELITDFIVTKLQSFGALSIF